MINVAILTVNSAVAEGRAVDTSGPALRDCLPPDSFHVKEHTVIDEDKALISAIIEKWAKPESDIQVIFTTGGTGIAPSDITPEAVSSMLHKQIPGIPEAIRHAALANSSRAMLSRGVAGIRNRTLIVTIPGNPKFAREAMQVVIPILHFAVTTIREDQPKAA